VQQQVLDPVQQSLDSQIATIQKLSQVASQHPYYKWNGMWQREVQSLVYFEFYPDNPALVTDGYKITSLQLHGWLRFQKLVTIEEVGDTMEGW
jgi:hypothetical protein